MVVIKRVNIFPMNSCIKLAFTASRTITKSVFAVNTINVASRTQNLFSNFTTPVKFNVIGYMRKNNLWKILSAAFSPQLVCYR